MSKMRVARGLGWFYIGLGLTEVAAGRQPGRALGMEDKSWLLRPSGVREIATGVAPSSPWTSRGPGFGLG